MTLSRLEEILSVNLLQEAFFANAHLDNEEDIIHAVARGRWYLKNEVIGAIQLKKYRTLRKRYGA